jgi:ABC-2 type transport system permease protein
MIEFTPPRPIGLVNWVGLKTLITRETGRFLNVYMQTLIAPVVTLLLYYAVFSMALGSAGRMIENVPYLQFLAPGLIMMTMVQNAFANTSSSIVIAKVQGNIVDVLLPPLSSVELFVGFVMGGVIRGLMVGVVAVLVVLPFVTLGVDSIAKIMLFGVLGCLLLAGLGLLAGLWSQKFDHIAAVTNFIVTPLTFLSGTFYDARSLPQPWHDLAYLNPFFYMIDGFRSGFIGFAESNWVVGAGVVGASIIVIFALTLWLLEKGYKIKT